MLGSMTSSTGDSETLGDHSAHLFRLCTSVVTLRCQGNPRLHYRVESAHLGTHLRCLLHLPSHRAPGCTLSYLQHLFASRPETPNPQALNPRP